MAKGSKDLPLGAEKVAMVRTMFDTIAARYDLMNTLMTFGLDRTWRARTLRALRLAPGSVVLDIGCGTADLARGAVARGHRSVGIDLSFAMLAVARPGGASLCQGDGATLPFSSSSIEGITSGFSLRNFADLATVFAEMARVLRAGGRVALLEVDRPTTRLLARLHAAWLGVIVPRLGALVSDRAAYAYLPASLAYLPGHDELAGLLGAAGFSDVVREPLSGGVAQLLSATRIGATPLSMASNKEGRVVEQS